MVRFCCWLGFSTEIKGSEARPVPDTGKDSPLSAGRVRGTGVILQVGLYRYILKLERRCVLLSMRQILAPCWEGGRGLPNDCSHLSPSC